MKATQRTLLAMSAVLIFGLGACSDDDDTVTPSTNKNYNPSTTGNFWVYESFMLDSNGNKQIETRVEDSTVVESKETKEGKEAFKFKSFITTNSGSELDSMYRAQEGLKVYEYVTLSSFSPVGEMDLGSKWALAIDFGNSQWDMLSETFTEVTLPAGFFTGDFEDTSSTIKFTPIVETKGTKSSGTASVTFEGKSMPAQEIVTTTNVTLSEVKYKTGILPEIPFGNVNFTIVSKSYYVENIGLVKSKQDPSSITLPLPGLPPFRIEGEEKILLRHNIK